MKQLFIKPRFVFSIALLTIYLYSCKTDEFKFDELTVKEVWSMKIISPMFAGKTDFKDLVYNWKDPIIFEPGDSVTVLKYPDWSFKPIPTKYIFEPSAIVDSFSFLIQGQYELANVEMIFTVANGSPFPLNLQLHFFGRNDPFNLGPPVLPPPFLNANFTSLPFETETNVHSVLLDKGQLTSFLEADRLKLVSWYNRTEYINQRDTLLSNYPIDISIVIVGEVKAKNEE